MSFFSDGFGLQKLGANPGAALIAYTALRLWEFIYAKMRQINALLTSPVLRPLITTIPMPSKPRSLAIDVASACIHSMQN